MNAKRPNSMRHLDDAIRRECGDNQDIDLAATKRTCERLFAYRQRQAWPPTVEARERWDEQYQALAEGMAIIQDVGEAIEWANALVSRIATA